MYHSQTFKYISTLEHRRQLNTTVQYFLKDISRYKSDEGNRHTTKLL